MQQALALTRDFLEHPDGTPFPPTDENYDISPKLKSLSQILQHSAKTTPPPQIFCSIVFVEKRLIAGLVAKCLAKLPDLEGVITCASLVGHGTNTPNEGMKYKEQNVLLDKFRYVVCTPLRVYRVYSVGFIGCIRNMGIFTSEVVNNRYISTVVAKFKIGQLHFIHISTKLHPVQLGIQLKKLCWLKCI